MGVHNILEAFLRKHCMVTTQTRQNFENGNSALRKCKILHYKLQWCSKQTAKISALRKWKFCAQEWTFYAQKMEIFPNTMES